MEGACRRLLTVVSCGPDDLFAKRRRATHGDTGEPAHLRRPRDSLAVGFRPSEPVDNVVLAFALVLAFAYVWSWISAFIGLTVRNPDAAQWGAGTKLGTLAWLIGLLLIWCPLSVRASRRA